MVARCLIAFRVKSGGGELRGVLRWIDQGVVPAELRKETLRLGDQSPSLQSTKFESRLDESIDPLHIPLRQKHAHRGQHEALKQIGIACRLQDYPATQRAAEPRL